MRLKVRIQLSRTVRLKLSSTAPLFVQRLPDQRTAAREYSSMKADSPPGN